MKTKNFDDFDAFAASVKDIDSKMLLRDPGRRFWSVSAAELGEMDLQLGLLGSGNIAQGELRSDGFMIYLPLTKNVEYTANGQVLNHDSLAVLEPGCEFCVSTKKPHDWSVVFMPSHLLPGDADLGKSKSCLVTVPNRGMARHLASIMQQIFQSAATCPQFESSPAAQLAAAALFDVATSIIGVKPEAKPNRDGRPKFSRREIIRSCMDTIDQNGDVSLDVRKLALAANVSERTLRNSFNDYFGIGPNRYFQLRQLHTIHCALKNADPSTDTVGGILAAHGEWAFSRFAFRHRKHFGQLPSETLRAKTAS